MRFCKCGAPRVHKSTLHEYSTSRQRVQYTQNVYSCVLVPPWSFRYCTFRYVSVVYYIYCKPMYRKVPRYTRYLYRQIPEGRYNFMPYLLAHRGIVTPFSAQPRRFRCPAVPVYIVPRTGRLTTRDALRSFFRLLSGRHFDVGVYSLDEIVRFPPLQLGAGAAGGPTVQTATKQTTWREWVVEADNACVAALTRAAAKVKDHSPAAVIPIIFSAGGAGGALRACDNDLLPEPEDRTGRHWGQCKGCASSWV